MRLQKLHLRGFKTFADRTEIEFKPGITAIVGPNGSGKSNLTDAILWVLGEQSHRAVRSEKWEDVIFGGTTQRAPLGMAEVALTIDNSDGALPVDYAEVVIARRLYRSGQSEYLLNGDTVRLRDIQDLIVDTGLSPGGYSIIGQGEIDAVLSARPEDRRELIEQVAGVRKYQIRRADAERKLDKTQANLARVKDISYELERQRQPLERQAVVARQYRELAEELKRLELTLLVLDWDRRQEKRGQALHEMELLRQQVDQNKLRLREIEAERERVQGEADEATRRLDETRERLAAAERRLDRSEQALSSASEHQEALVARRNHLQPACGELEQLEAALAERLAALAQQASDLAAEAAALEPELTRQQTALEAEQERQAARQQERTAVQQRAAELDRELALALREFEAMEGLRLELGARLERLEAQQVFLLGRRDGLQAEVEGLRKAVREAGQQATARREQWQARQQQHQGDRQRLREHRQKKEILASHVAALESRAEVLEELASAQEGFAEGPRRAMQAAKEGLLQGVIGLAGDLVDVPRKLEVAVEAGLGERLQWVLVESVEAARAGAELLAAEGAGRATFLAIDRVLSNVRGSEVAGIERGPGIVGNLRRLLKFPPKLAHVFEALLEDVMIVDSTEAAWVLRNRLRGPARIVTLRGEVIGPLGELSAGAGDSGVKAAFARRREMQALADRLAAMRRHMALMWETEELLEQRLAATAAEVQELEAELHRFEREAEAGEAQMRGLADNLRAAVAAAQESGAEVELLRERRSQTAEQAAKAQLLAQGLQVELQGVAAQRDALEGQEAGPETLASLRQTVSDTQISLAQVRERLHAAADLQRQTEAELGRVRDDRAQRTQELLELEARLRELPGQSEAATRERDQLAAQVEQLTQEAGGRGQELAELRRVSADLERSRHDVEALGEQHREELYRAELNLARSEAAMESLEAQLAEIYSCTVEEARGLRPAGFAEPHARREANRLRAAIRELGPVNLSAIDEVERLGARLEYLGKQVLDLEQARADLLEVIAEVDSAAREAFLSALGDIGEAFQELFEHFFPGGLTSLELTTPEYPLTSGVEVLVQLPGKRRQNLLLLSGGERAMTAVALLFAMIKVRPAPFCLMDEIDAAIDAANTEKLVQIIAEFAQRSQFIVITHNPRTMEAASVLYGVTLRQGGGSRLISVTLEDAKRTAKQQATAAGPSHASHGGATSRVLPVTS